MNRYLPLISLLLLSFLVSCEDDGEYSPYFINEPSDGTIESGKSGTTPYFMREDSAEHCLTMGKKDQTIFYSLDQIKHIELTFDVPDWEEQLIDMASGDSELYATLAYNGGSPKPEKVGVRIKGSVAHPGAKPSYYVAIDAVDNDQLLYRYSTLILSSIEDDTSCIREAIYRQCIRRYIPAAQVNYIKVSINGADQGLYINTEHIKTSFIEEWFLSSNGSRWRAEPTNAADSATIATFGIGKSGLNYLGDEVADYAHLYNLKNNSSEDEPLEDIITVCRILEKTHPDLLEDTIRKELDLDRTLWFLACENIFTDEDSYVNKGGTDYYLFWNEDTELLTPLEYDGNNTFKIENVGWDPFYHADDTRFPLLNKLLAAPAIRQRYLAHYRTILKEVFNPDYLNPLIDQFVSKIESDVDADPRKMFTLSQFSAAVTAMKQAIAQRAVFLNNHNEVNVTGMIISSVKWSVDGTDWKQPLSTDTVTITAKVSGSGFASSVYLCAGTGMFGGFKRLQMYDDGSHGDIIADDGTFTAFINPQPSGRVRYYIEAVKGNAAKTRTYMPAGAEHDVYTYKVQ